MKFANFLEISTLMLESDQEEIKMSNRGRLRIER